MRRALVEPKRPRPPSLTSAVTCSVGPQPPPAPQRSFSTRMIAYALLSLALTAHVVPLIVMTSSASVGVAPEAAPDAACGSTVKTCPGWCNPAFASHCANCKCASCGFCRSPEPPAPPLPPSLPPAAAPAPSEAYWRLTAEGQTLVDPERRPVILSGVNMYMEWYRHDCKSPSCQGAHAASTKPQHSLLTQPVHRSQQ